MATETRIGGTGDLGEAATRTIDQASSNINKAIDKASDAARPAVKHILQAPITQTGLPVQQTGPLNHSIPKAGA